MPLNPYLRAVTRSFRSTIATVFVFSFFVNLLTLAVPLYLLQIYDKVLPGRNTDTLMFLTGMALVAIVALGALESIRRSMLVKLGTHFDDQVSDHLLDSAIHRSIAKDRASVNVMRDLATVRGFLSGSSIFPLLDAPWTPLFLFILYLLHPLLGLIGLAGALIMFGLAVLNEWLTREPVKQSNQDARELLDDAQITIRNADVVQAMGMQGTVLQSWKARNAEALAANYEASRVNTRLSSISKMVKMFLQIGIICAAAWLILQQQVTAGVTIASLLLMRRAIAPLEQSIRSWKSVIKTRAAYRNISEYLDHAASLAPARAMPQPAGVLRAHKASFRRSGSDRSIFSRIEMEAAPGEICAIVGPTAAGKSTFLRVLAGVVQPTSGKVTLGGYELNQWTPDQLGPCIGYLPQEVGLFTGSVRDNISRLTEAPVDQVVAAAKLANAHEMIQQLPAGYDTDLAEYGQNLSGGQRQRIGLARAVFGQPAVLLLDEPDANLDAAGRSLLRKALRELRRQGAAIVVITHHSSLEKQANKVYRLEAGKLRLEEQPDKGNALVALDMPAEALPGSIVATDGLGVNARPVNDEAPATPALPVLHESPAAEPLPEGAAGAVTRLAYTNGRPVLPPHLQAMERKLKRRLALEKSLRKASAER